MASQPAHRQLAVIGAGPGGYAAAFLAADLGMEVALISDEPRLGGVCLHRGCIPSKALLHAAKLLNEARRAGHWGINFPQPRIDLRALRSWKESIVDKLAGGIDQLCRQRQVESIHARAAFADSNTLRLEPIADPVGRPAETLSFDQAIVATGSSPVIPDGLRLDDPRVMDSTGALELPDDLDQLLVVGGGYIGLEMGTVYAALGASVTVVELTDGLLPGVDRDLVKPLHARLNDTFEAIHLNTRVEGLEPRDEAVAVRLTGPRGASEQLFDHVLVAVGRRPNSRGIGLEHTDVALDERGFIKVDSRQRTAQPHILAVGDVAGEPMLAHKATRQAKVAVEALAGEASAFDNAAVPAVVFTDPELAWCGLTETQARTQGRDVRVVRFPWTASGRAVALGRTEGLTKLIVEPTTQRLLGMGVVGAGAGELIAEGVLAVETAMVLRDLVECIHAHPTLSETVAESAEAFFGRATHLFQPKVKH